MNSIYIATPMYDGKVSHLYTLGAIQSSKLNLQFGFTTGPCIAGNRERLTQGFLSTDCSHLMWIDSDIGWTRENLEALLAADLDMVSGIYVRRQMKKEVPAQPLTGNELDLSMPQLVECSALPTGFLLLKRSMVVLMRENFRSSIWEHGIDVGEDVMFCRRWRSVGGKMFLHTGVVVKHIGEHVFEP